MSHIDDLFAVRDKYITRQIRGERIRAEKERREKILWKGKLAVTDFKSLTDCPKKVVADKANVDKRKERRFKTATTYKLDLGNEVHDSYQKSVMNTPGLKWIKPYNFPDKHSKRLEEVWPEIPLFYEVYPKYYCKLPNVVTYGINIGLIDKGIGRFINPPRIVISGIADDCAVYLDKPAITEYKSVNGDPIKFKHYFNENYPLAGHIYQLKAYIFLSRKMKIFYPYFAKDGFLIYINTRMEAGDDDAEQELYYSLSQVEEELYEQQYAEADHQLLALDKMIDIDCNYLNCKEHGNRDSPRDIGPSQ